MHYVGLDVHARRSSLCILDPCGKVVKRLEVKGPWPKLLERVAAEVPRPFSVCFEASCGYGYLHERLSALAEHVAVAHPGKLRLIFRSKRKNDRVDAEKQAKLLYLDQVPQVHVPTFADRELKGTSRPPDAHDPAADGGDQPRPRRTEPVRHQARVRSAACLRRRRRPR